MTRDLHKLQTLRDSLHKLADSIIGGAPLAEDLAREMMLALEAVAHLVYARAPRMRADPYDTSRDGEDDEAWRGALAHASLGEPGDDEERGDAARERRLAYERHMAEMRATDAAADEPRFVEAARAADAARCTTCDHPSALHVGGDGACMYDDANDHTPCACDGFTIGTATRLEP